MAPHKKSQHGLTRCPTCRTHTRAASTPGTTTCGFCGTRLTAPRRRFLSGRGGLIAASLLAASAAGCGTSEPGAESPASQTEAPDPGWDPNTPANEGPTEIYGAPPMEEEAEEPEAAENSEESAPDEFVPEQEAPAAATGAYGAPPSERGEP